MIADILLNIKQIDYFEKYQNITVIPIQDYGRLTKFKIKANEELFHQDNCYIHADATCTNIVINTQQKKLYFIDFDDFKIGDPFYDISRLGNFRYIKVIDNYLTNNYPNLEKDLRHNFYTLRTVLVWYLHIKNNHQEDKYELPIKELQELVIKCA